MLINCSSDWKSGAEALQAQTKPAKRLPISPWEQTASRAAANRIHGHGALPAHLPRYEVVINIEDQETPHSRGASPQAWSELRTDPSNSDAALAA